MTGRLPDNTRTWNFINNFRQGGMDNTGVKGADWTSFPEHFKNNGYTTLGHGKLYHPNKPPNNDEPASLTTLSPTHFLPRICSRSLMACFRPA